MSSPGRVARSRPESLLLSLFLPLFFLLSLLAKECSSPSRKRRGTRVNKTCQQAGRFEVVSGRIERDGGGEREREGLRGQQGYEFLYYTKIINLFGSIWQGWDPRGVEGSGGEERRGSGCRGKLEGVGGARVVEKGGLSQVGGGRE